MTSSAIKALLKRRRMLPVLILGGILMAMSLVASRQKPQRYEGQVPELLVEAIEVKRMPIRAETVAFGEVMPSLILEANSEVGGRVVSVSADLEPGAIISAGAPILNIDETSYQLAVAQAESDLAVYRAKLQELEVEKANSQRSLEIAQRTLELGEQELQRKEQLAVKGIVSRSAADAEEQRVLKLRQEVELQKGNLSLFPTRRQVIKAQISRAEALLGESRYQLSRTRISLPYNVRIGDVYVEAGQSVAHGTPLFVAYGMDQVEVSAELTMAQIVPLFRSIESPSDQTLSPDDFSDALLGLEARVGLVGGIEPVEWRGRVVRVGGTMDTTSRTLSVVVAVDNPYRNIVAEGRPPLFRGMYARIKLIAPPSPALVIPRRAMHEGRVYLAENNQLKIRTITVDYYQGDLAVVRSGLVPGDQVITTDVIPAISGTAVSVIDVKMGVSDLAVAAEEVGE
ncbi:efflux RND transporter periplasmic adaptor subunit [Microbulbifer sp. SSSA005]|uniref:efflux RND transporter periplasmic adaptor subunit n=1 Tax=Microbulbifer sp. SSSA005 TaxID=3243378 RepID=UPI00403A2DC3